MMWQLRWRFVNWVDDRWLVFWIRADRRAWDDLHPRLWGIGTVPLSTWLGHPVDGWQSYRRVVGPLLLEREMKQLADDDLSS